MFFGGRLSFGGRLGSEILTSLEFELKVSDGQKKRKLSLFTSVCHIYFQGMVTVISLLSLFSLPSTHTDHGVPTPASAFFANRTLLHAAC